MTAWGVIVCAIMGGLIGAIELFGRYRTYPTAALRSVPGVVYVLLNAVASATTFILSEALDWQFGLPTSSNDAITVVRILVVGFGAMAVLRSSLFKFTRAKQQLTAGPGAVLSGLRAAVDRVVDQQHAQTAITHDLIAGVNFARDHEELTLLCSAALINPPAKLPEDLGAAAADLKPRAAVSDEVKLQAYAMKLGELVGRGPLEAAARRLRSIRAAESPTHGSQPAVAATATAVLIPALNVEEQVALRQTAETNWTQARAASQLLQHSLGLSSRTDLQLLRAYLLEAIDQCW